MEHVEAFLDLLGAEAVALSTRELLERFDTYLKDEVYNLSRCPHCGKISGEAIE